VFAILAEADSDIGALKTLIRRILGDNSVPIRGKSYDGCGTLLKKGARDLAAFIGVGASHFIICHDADGSEPNDVSAAVIARVISPLKTRPSSYCVVVPVQELEAWLLSDMNALTTAVKKFQAREIPNPENISDPKKQIIRLGRDESGKEQYDPVVHNEKVAKWIDLAILRQKCRSFRPFLEYVESSRS